MSALVALAEAVESAQDAILDLRKRVAALEGAAQPAEPPAPDDGKPRQARRRAVAAVVVA